MGLGYSAMMALYWLSRLLQITFCLLKIVSHFPDLLADSRVAFRSCLSMMPKILDCPCSGSI